MSLGHWLDTSVDAAHRALTELRTSGLPIGDVPAALYTRPGKNWLANAADLIRGTPRSGRHAAPSASWNSARPGSVGQRTERPWP